MENTLLSIFIIISLAGGFSVFVTSIGYLIKQFIEDKKLNNVVLTKEEQEEIEKAALWSDPMSKFVDNITRKRGISRWSYYNYNKATKVLKIR